MNERPVLLFVDDEERVGRLMTMMFRGEYDVYAAASARDALDVLEAVQVDVIVSDQRMPGMTGIQLFRHVRERWPDTVRIMLTGYTDLVAIIGALNEGEVYRFLTKPSSPMELRTAIADAVARSQSLRDMRESMPSIWPTERVEPQFSIASQLLAIEGRNSERQQVVEMFACHYRVRTASTIKEAIDILAVDQIGVIVANAKVGGIDITEMLAEIPRIDPAITVVVMTASPRSDAIIRLINNGGIYRFAVQPLSPDIFRLAVNAAMREHHRRLADPRMVRVRMLRDALRAAARDDGFERIASHPDGFRQVG